MQNAQLAYGVIYLAIHYLAIHSISVLPTGHYTSHLAQGSTEAHMPETQRNHADKNKCS